MQQARSKQRLCSCCSNHLFNIFLHGFSRPNRFPKQYGSIQWEQAAPRYRQLQARNFTTHKVLKVPENLSTSEAVEQASGPLQIESNARRARQTFGETLPENFLSTEEYHVYERLYGAPLATTTLEDVELLTKLDRNDIQEDGLPPNALMKEDIDGNLEVVHQDEELVRDELENIEVEGDEFLDLTSLLPKNRFENRLRSLRYKALKDLERLKAESEAIPEEEQGEEEEFEENEEEEEEIENEEVEEQEDLERTDYYSVEKKPKGHHLTREGRFGTFPSTVFLPKETFVNPINHMFSGASNKQIAEVAERSFGGEGLPDSTATFKRPNLTQKTIGLEASQGKMGEMEANAYLAAVYPGAYASIMSVLTEVRKRLGSKWIRNLIRSHEGPRVLDAGAGGAGVLAWRDIITAEYESMNSSGSPLNGSPPFGKSTVVTGSPTLRHRVSQLLENTSFIPRLPDYDPSRDHPSLETSNPQPRKQYDIIIAPYTLWPLKEDYMRKSQVQNFWSLLDPNGGVLVLIEKGLPIGFEMIGGARETLLKHHISSPGSETIENDLEDPSPNRFTHKETGMIIAPCTNHGKCPMYHVPGRAQGRKDFCYFNQRFIRPPFLQDILGQKSRNHEDVQFSYVAFQRGKDARQEHGFEQGQTATDAAFEGYRSIKPPKSSSPPPASPAGAFTASQKNTPSKYFVQPHVQTFPRLILPPLKRDRHVTIDVCTPAATIERWTVPKSFGKKIYQDARKAQWGDLWALGAKSRAVRNLRLGEKKSEQKGSKKVSRAQKAVAKEEAEDMEEYESAEMDDFDGRNDDDGATFEGDELDADPIERQGKPKLSESSKWRKKSSMKSSRERTQEAKLQRKFGHKSKRSSRISLDDRESSPSRGRIVQKRQSQRPRFKSKEVDFEADF